MNYDVVIGLEVHVQVKSNSKMFCGCPNEYGAEPNSNVCPVCLGYPGVLPTVNAEMIRKAAMAGMMTNCTIAPFSKFDRKSYFYPDQAKNYQISQYDLPICLDGFVRISGTGLSGKELPDKKIRLNRIHMEEDVAKSTHFGSCTGVDFNRAGVPLLESVTEPDISSADEAYAYLTALKQIMQYGGISDCDAEKGQIRCDVNISLMPKGATEYGTKVEIKNLNSFRAVHRSIDFEIKRQSKIYDEGRGEEIQQETRGWNDDKGITYLMRIKESANDYRYFPEPDLLPVTFTESQLDALRAELPEGPEARRNRYQQELELSEYDAGVLTADKDLADYFEKALAAGGNAKLLANWIMSELMRELNQSDRAITDCPVAPEQLAQLVTLIDKKTINGKIAKQVFADMFETSKDPEVIVKEKGLIQVTDTGAIEKFVEEVIAANPGPVADYQSGNDKAINSLVGQVMKASKGKANPGMVLQVLKDKLS